MITFGDFKNNLKKKYKAVIFIVNLALFLGLGLSLIQTFLYRTDFSILIVQDTKQSTDIYTSIESSDKLASLLSKMIYTSDFQSSVLKSGFNLNKNDFSSSELKKRNQWKNMVNVSIVPGTGILNFDVYYKNKSGSLEYANAIIHSIVNDGAQIYGGSDLIKFKVINSPLTSDRPATPNILVNSILSIFVGLVVAMFYGYFTTTEFRNKDVVYEEDEDEKIVNNTYNQEKKDIILNSKGAIDGFNKEEVKVEVPEEVKIDHIKEINQEIIKDEISKPAIVEDHKLNVIGENKKEDVISANDVKVVYDEQHTHNMGFIKNLNDRVKDIIK